MEDVADLLRVKVDPVIRALSRIEDVRGMLCFGSYAMGTFDACSDVDLYVFCHPAIPGSQARKDAYVKIPGTTHLEIDHVESGPAGRWCPRTDRFRLNDTVMDISWDTVEWISTVVRKVTKESCTSIPELPFRPYTMLGLLETSVILHDPGSMLRNLKSAVRPYPARLKQALVSEGLAIIRASLDELRDCVRRGIGNTAFHFHFERVLDALGTTLFAINERYDPATKRAEEAYNTLGVVPPDFVKRYVRLLQLPLTEEGRHAVVAELEGITKDIERLAERAPN
jgi:hypothetical protein